MPFRLHESRLESAGHRHKAGTSPTLRVRGNVPTTFRRKKRKKINSDNYHLCENAKSSHAVVRGFVISNSPGKSDEVEADHNVKASLLQYTYTCLKATIECREWWLSVALHLFNVVCGALIGHAHRVGQAPVRSAAVPSRVTGPPSIAGYVWKQKACLGSNYMFN